MKAWRRLATPISFHLSPRRSQGCPGQRASLFRGAGRDACPENMAGWSIREARAMRGSVSGRDVDGARRRGKVGGGELERQGWRQVQRVPAAPWSGSFLPSSLPFSFLPFPPYFIPCFPSFSFLPSLLPAFLPPAPPLLLSLPSPRTKPARAWLPAGPERPLGSPRSLPEPRRALSRRPPHSRESERPGGSCSFYGARRQRHCPGVSCQLARAAAASMRAIHTRGRCGIPLGVRGLPRVPVHMVWVGVGCKHGFQGTQQRRGSRGPSPG